MIAIGLGLAVAGFGIAIVAAYWDWLIDLWHYGRSE